MARMMITKQQSQSIRRQLKSMAIVLGLFILSATAAYADKPSAPAPVVEAQNEKPVAHRNGQWIRIHLPIDNAGVLRAKQAIQRGMGRAGDMRPVFVLEFVMPEGAVEAAQGTQFEDAHKLARFLVSDELNGANTVAFIPTALKGHAVLVALACDQIIMGSTATLGEAGIDEKTINNTMLAAYEEIAKSRHTVPVEIALAMLDKSRQILKVQTDADVQFVAPGGLPEIAARHTIIKQEQIKPPGEPWQFTGAEGRKLGLVKYLADDRRDVIRAMELSPEIADGDPSDGKPWHAIRIELKGPVRAAHVDELQRLIEDERRKGANFICVWIDSPGGDPIQSKRLADCLIDMDRNEVRTVAFIPTEARADAALVALACDQIVMQPRAILGGSGAYQMTADEIVRYRLMLRDSLCPKKVRAWSMWAAMFDPGLDVFRCRRLGDVEYFSDEELTSRQPKREQGEKGTLWEKGEAITRPGRVLSLNDDKATEYGVATLVVENFSQFKQHYGLENDPTLVEPGWVDKLARFLGTHEMAALLIFLGGLGIYIELHMPGLGIGAFMSVVAFALFFWSHFLQGTATWLEVTLFITGGLCLLLEIFVLPGLLIFGLGGGALILASIVLASQTFLIPRNEYQMAQLQGSLMTLAAGVAGLVGTILVLNRYLPHAPVLHSMFLHPPEGEEAEVISRREMLVDLNNLVGQIGLATTPIGPSGKARFGNHLVDVITSGEFVARDSQVVVVEVHGNRVVVKAAEKSV